VAIAQGYDAITMIPDGTIVILNRGALRIQKTNANARNSMYAQIMMEVDKQAEIDKEKKDKEEKKRKEQLRKQQEQEKKLSLDQKKAKLEQTHPALPQKTTKSYDVIAFDSDIFSVLSSRHDISNTEKMEIINFIQQYNDTDGETKRMLSVQLKEIMQ
jgi:glycyl-tRNA synthetase alpha subunit